MSGCNRNGADEVYEKCDLYGNGKTPHFKNYWENTTLKLHVQKWANVTTDRREIFSEDVHWIQLATTVAVDKLFLTLGRLTTTIVVVPHR